jgi:hypothetical protein
MHEGVVERQAALMVAAMVPGADACDRVNQAAAIDERSEEGVAESRVELMAPGVLAEQDAVDMVNEADGTDEENEDGASLSWLTEEEEEESDFDGLL